MAHTAQAVLLHCMDFRFIHEIVHFMKAAGLIDQYDDVSVAGAATNTSRTKTAAKIRNFVNL